MRRGPEQKGTSTGLWLPMSSNAAAEIREYGEPMKYFLKRLCLVALHDPRGTWPRR